MGNAWELQEISREMWLEAIETMIKDPNITVNKEGRVVWTSGMAAGAWMPGIGEYVEDITEAFEQSNTQEEIDEQKILRQTYEKKSNNNMR